MIYVVGLGCSSGDISVKGYKLLSGKQIFIRSTHLKCGEFLFKKDWTVNSFDHLFLECDSFEEINKTIEETLLRESEKGDVVYLVDGSGYQDEVALSLTSKNQAKLIPAIGKEGFIFKKHPVKQCLIMTASDFLKESNFEYGKNLVLTDVDSFELASDVKIKLMEIYGDEKEVVVHNESTMTLPIFDLDSFATYSYETTIFAREDQLKDKTRFNFKDILDILDVLRGENGCPWDKAQTHTSIKGNLIEEAYEALEAIEDENDFMLEEEVGDVLLQCVFHGNLAKSRGAFTISDITSLLGEKLVSRHTHIFGSAIATNEGEALDTWEKNKLVEKNHTTFSQTLDAVPKTFPALLKAAKVSKRASKANYDVSGGVKGYLGKAKEELLELEEAILKNDGIIEELGDTLFALSSLARVLEIDAEDALNKSTQKFKDRFRECERLILADGKEMLKITDEDYGNYYEMAKANVKNKS